MTITALTCNFRCLTRAFILSASLATVAAAQNKSSLPAPSTRAERTSYRETSSYLDVIAFIDSLKAMKAPIVVSELAKSTNGLSIPFIVASRPMVSSPAEARRLNRPIVYVQANIHAGEVEGKEAVLALLREWSFGKRPNVLDSLVVIVVPIYNADGNEKLGQQARNRSEQNGPQMIGERPNAMGLDLNRDYVKAEAPETRGSLAAFNTWDPDVFMDLHTTDGSFHGYALTYAQSLHPAAPLGVYTVDTLLPEVRKRMRSRHNFDIFPYGNFSADNRESLTATDKSGWFTYDHRQRFGTNYYGLRGRISILSEAMSHDPFERRVASTHAFVQEVLSLVAEQRGQMRERIERGVAASTFTVTNRTPVPVRARFNSRPPTGEVLVEVLEPKDTAVAGEPGMPKSVRRTGRMLAKSMPIVDRFESALNREPTLEGYLLDASWTDAVRQLRAHGLTVTPTDKPMSATLQVFDIDSVAFATRPFQGHKEATVTGKWRADTRVVPAGTFVVRMATDRDLLAMELLEPESDDGLLTWNAFDPALIRGKEAPVARLTAPLRLYSPGKSSSSSR